MARTYDPETKSHLLLAAKPAKCPQPFFIFECSRTVKKWKWLRSLSHPQSPWYGYLGCTGLFHRPGRPLFLSSGKIPDYTASDPRTISLPPSGRLHLLVLSPVPDFTPSSGGNLPEYALTHHFPPSAPQAHSEPCRWHFCVTGLWVPRGTAPKRGQCCAK